MTPEDVPEGFTPFAGGIAPSYDGRGIANIAPTIMRHFGVDASRPGLAADVVPPALADAERVVLVIVDGLGWDQFQRSPAARRFRSAVPVTSVLPTTTVAGLASLATGLPPGEHGLLGYRTLLPRLGSIVNLVRVQPYYGSRSLFDYGVTEADVFPFTPMMARLNAAGVSAGVVTRDAYTTSGLSRMIYQGTTPEGYVGLADLLASGRRLLDAAEGARAFVELYWDEVDATSHRYGPFSTEQAASVDLFLNALADAFGPYVEDGRTAVLLTADHGHVHVDRGNVLDVNAHPEVLRHLVIPPTGEGRFAYLHVADGDADAARAAVEDTWPGLVDVVDAGDVVKQGHFGPPPHHPELRQRVGSLIAIPRGERKFEYHPTPRMGPRPLLGNHGGVLRGEMLVPLAAL